MRVRCLKSCTVFVSGQGREKAGYEKDEEFTIRKDSELAEILKHDRNFEILDKPDKSPEENPDEDEESDSEGDE
jgi:hypothetical protein